MTFLSSGGARRYLLTLSARPARVSVWLSRLVGGTVLQPRKHSERRTQRGLRWRGCRRRYGQQSFDRCGGLPRAALGARAAKDLRCCSVFGAAQRDPLPAVDAEVAATAFRRGRSLPDAAGAARKSSRVSTAAAACLDTEHNNLELERHRINRPQEPYIRFNRVVAPRIQTHLIPGRLVARRLRLIQIILKIRRHSE